MAKILLESIQSGSLESLGLNRLVQANKGLARMEASEGYNYLAEQYNKLPAGTFMRVNCLGMSVPLLQSVLGYRGLSRKTDFDVVQINRDENGMKIVDERKRFFVIKKLTPTQMRTVKL